MHNLWVHSEPLNIWSHPGRLSSLKPCWPWKIQLPCVSSTTSGFSPLIPRCTHQNCHCLGRCSCLRQTTSVWHVSLLLPVFSTWLVTGCSSVSPADCHVNRVNSAGVGMIFKIPCSGLTCALQLTNADTLFLELICEYVTKKKQLLP